jgi:hypothetical protein
LTIVRDDVREIPRRITGKDEEMCTTHGLAGDPEPDRVDDGMAVGSEVGRRRRSAAFGGPVGVAVPAASVSERDYLIDTDRYSSEGNWAFCRFESDEIPAIRLGFELGGFNPGPMAARPNRAYLQLHLEVMTREGALFWLPSGKYGTQEVVSDPDRLDVRLETGRREVFRLQGWPDIACHFGSDDGDLEVDLRFDLTTVCVLPDALLPHCVFAMWESMGRAHGQSRYRDRTVALDGTVFFDHPRVIERSHDVAPRQMYLYTTLQLEDGSGLFGYYALDALARPIEGYCFCVYVDTAGNGCLLSDAALGRLDLDEDDIANAWQVTWRAAGLMLDAEVRVRPGPILRSWGGPNAPQTRREFGFPPLVLDSAVRIHEGAAVRDLRGWGLGEYFNADLVAADLARRVEPGPPPEPAG